MRSNGEIKWRGKLVDINSALAGEPVGLAEGEHGAQRVGYGPVALGVPWESLMSLRDEYVR